MVESNSPWASMAGKIEPPRQTSQPSSTPSIVRTGRPCRSMWTAPKRDAGEAIAAHGGACASGPPGAGRGRTALRTRRPARRRRRSSAGGAAGATPPTMLRGRLRRCSEVARPDVCCSIAMNCTHGARPMPSRAAPISAMGRAQAPGERLAPLPPADQANSRAAREDQQQLVAHSVGSSPCWHPLGADVKEQQQGNDEQRDRLVRRPAVGADASPRPSRTQPLHRQRLPRRVDELLVAEQPSGDASMSPA